MSKQDHNKAHQKSLKYLKGLRKAALMECYDRLVRDWSHKAPVLGTRMAQTLHGGREAYMGCNDHLVQVVLVEEGGEEGCGGGAGPH